MRFKLLAAFLALLSLCSCESRMDPYVDGPGTRINVNGKKYVMQGLPLSSKYSSITQYDEYYEYNAVMRLKHLTDRLWCELELNITSPEQFEPGRMYEFTSACLSWHYIAIEEDEDVGYYNYVVDKGPSIPLKGWLEFVRIGSQDVEAQFELDEVSGKKTQIRHGFLRLWTDFIDRRGGE